jgi:putative ABC transport system substrate-binding protein
MAIGIGRRQFITALGASVAWPLTVRAQQPTMPIIGILSNGAPEATASRIVTIRQTLSEANYVDGQNVAIEYRLEGTLAEQCANLVARHAAVIVADGNVAALTAKSATSTIPVVFDIGGDPVRLGLTASLNRPGGNATGVSLLTTASETKRLELLGEMIPQVTKIAILVNPNSATTDAKLKELQAAAGVLGRKLHVLNASSEAGLDIAFANIVQEHIGGLLIASDNFLHSETSKLAALAVRHAVPAIFAYRPFAIAGGLASYGTSQSDAEHQVGLYIVRILKGEKPADLPVQQAVKVELVINLKSAKTLGLTLPLPLLGRADEVIE